MLDIASRHPAAATLRYTAADARALPFADCSFDVALCSLSLHHMRPGDAVRMLAELRRVARLGLVVNDLVRCWHGLVGAWLFGNVLSRNPLTRHDAPLSFRRAYTVTEMQALAREAGLDEVRFRGFFGFRVCMLYELPNARSLVARAA